MKAAENSTRTTGSTLKQNCPYNARATTLAFQNEGYDARTVFGAVVTPDNPHPDETSQTLEMYGEEAETLHWWTEVKLTPNTWWVVDLWSLHPARDGKSLVMAERPPEYLPIEINPEHESMFNPVE